MYNLILKNVLLNLVFLAFAGAVGVCLFTQVLFNLKIRFKTSINCILCITFVDYIFFNLSKYYGMPLKSIAVFIFTGVFIKVFYKLKLSYCFLSSTLYFIILGIANAITAIIFKFIDKIFTYAANDFFYNLIAYSIINIIVFLIIFIIKSFKVFSKLPEKIRTRGYITNIAVIVSAFVIIMFNFNYYISYNAYINSLPLILNIAAIMGFFILCIINTNTFFKLENKSYELENQIFYNKTMESLMGELKRFKHNYNNMLVVINGYIKLKQWDGLSKYFSEIIETTNNFEQNGNISLLNIKSAGILGILTSKIEYAKNNKIVIKTLVYDEIKEVDMKISELCEVLGVLLDNAIEEANVCKNDKCVDIIIEKENGYVSFIVENSITKKVDIKEIFKDGYTTKGNGHGTGLHIVKKIIEKYDNVVLNSAAKNNKFIQELVITEKRKSAAS